MQQLMPRLARSKVFKLLIAALLATALILGIRAVLDGKRLQSLNPNTVQQMMDGPPPRDEGIEMSETLSSDHPFIYAGIHFEKIYELNLNSRTFTADGEIWLEWRPEVDELLKRNGTNPADLITFANRIET